MSKIDLNGKEAYKMSYVIKNDDEENESKSNISMIYVVQVAFEGENKEVNILTLAVRNGKYNDVKDIFEEIIKSYKSEKK